MGLLSEFRKWLDADEDQKTTVATDEQIKPRNKAEEFLVGVARDVEKTMMAEMFTPPGGPTYIPREYIVYLSPVDDEEWRGEKRKGLEQGLFHVLSERAGLIASEQQLQASSFAVDLKVDGTLAAGKFRVQAVWDTETAKTVVKARRAPAPAPVRRSEPVIAAGQKPLDDSDATIVRPRKATFSVTVSRDGEGGEKYDFSQAVVVIGRGSSTMPVDIPLTEDMEISRRQATLKHDGNEFKLTCEGQNSIFVDGKELSIGSTAAVEAGQKIIIGPYILEIRLPASANDEL